MKKKIEINTIALTARRVSGTLEQVLEQVWAIASEFEIVIPIEDKGEIIIIVGPTSNLEDLHKILKQKEQIDFLKQEVIDLKDRLGAEKFGMGFTDKQILTVKRNMLKTRIDALGFPIELSTALSAADIFTIGDLAQLKAYQLSTIYGIGKAYSMEIVRKFKEIDMEFGINILDYFPEDSNESTN